MAIPQLPKKGMSVEDKRKMLGDAYTVSYRFATSVYQKFPGLIKSIVLFGSIPKQTFSEKSDIDILIIVDDTAVSPSRSFIDWYNIELVAMIRKHDPRLHITTVTLSTFWDNIRVGEPVAINMLRYGVSLIDTGYFEPLQFLLQKGKIRPSEEAIYNALTRAPWHLSRANARILGAMTDFYWTAVDSAHAALMTYNQVPPSPEHIEEMLESTFVVHKKLSRKYVNYYHEIWKTAKAVVHGEIVRLGGADFDRYRQMTEEFEKEMKRLTESKK